MDMTAFTNDKDTIECLAVLYDLFTTVGGLRMVDTTNVQAEVSAALVSLLVTLPDNKVWQANAGTCVPTLRTLAYHIRSTAIVLDRHVNDAKHIALLQARLFHFAVDLLVECVRPMLDKEAHSRFMLAIYATLAVLPNE